MFNYVLIVCVHNNFDMYSNIIGTRELTSTLLSVGMSVINKVEIA